MAMLPEYSLLHWLLLAYIASSVFIAIAVVVVLLTAPTQYNPYNADLIQNVGQKERIVDVTDIEDEKEADVAQNVKGIKTETSVQVVVLGDIGRSPRMQYHAKSLVKNKARVVLVGYLDSDIQEDLASSPNVTTCPLKPPPPFFQTSNPIVFLLLGPSKVLWQALNLYLTLAYSAPATKFMLVQNPPSIPTLLIAHMICFLRNERLIIDWHNFGWTVLANKFSAPHPLVAAYKAFEVFFGVRVAGFSPEKRTKHITVSDAMNRYLKKNLGVEASTITTLHDRPAAHIKPIDRTERANFLKKWEEIEPYISEVMLGQLRLLVSSTSWTPDEDFGMLLDALVLYSDRATHYDEGEDESRRARLPYINVMITGNGPQKEMYTKRIQDLDKKDKLSHVSIHTAWLSTEDYASLLGSADVGVCLHKSTSGVDLPMKVADMFGAGLPVLGWSKYESWPELVKEGINGKGFKSAAELADLIEEVFAENGRKLNELRVGALGEGSRRWDAEWDEKVAKKVFEIRV